MTRHLLLAVSAGIVLSVAAVPAHHSASSAYDTAKKITMKGTVTKVEWKNPHVFYYLDVADTSGTVANWAIEGSTPNQLYRNRWRKDDLKIGDAVTVTGSSPARNGTRKAYGGTLTLADGRRVFGGSAATDQQRGFREADPPFSAARVPRSGPAVRPPTRYRGATTAASSGLQPYSINSQSVFRYRIVVITGVR